MNWIQAYVNAVKADLPASTREDIGAELQTLLEEAVESRTGKAPDALSDEEMVAWLKTREHPALVAARYQERRSLIGEEVYPLFKLTLRYVLIGLAVAYTALAFLRGLAAGAEEMVFSLPDLAASILHSGLLAFAGVTLVFHFCGSYFNASERLAKWNPKDLPDPKQKWEQEPRSSSIAGLVFTGLFLLVVNGLIAGIHEGFRGRDTSPLDVRAVEAAAQWLPWINLVLIGSILLYAFMVVKPYWSTTSLSFNMLLSAATAVVVYQLQGVQPLLVLGPEASEDANRIIGLVNTSLSVSLVIILLVNLWEIARDAWRLHRLGSRRRF